MRTFLELSRRTNGLPNNYGKQNEMYSNRERHHSFSNGSRDQHPSHQCSACARIRNELNFNVLVTGQGI